MEVYLDNSATTKCFVQAADLMTQILCEDYGNPSSLHRKGVQAEQYIRYAKEEQNVIQLLRRNHITFMDDDYQNLKDHVKQVKKVL